MAELEIRRATPEDRPRVLALLRASLGWGGDPRYEEFFAWKHDQNPFGPSPAWVALDGDRVVGFRTFMRWEFERDGEIVRAVRAVDTATHPEYQGRGIFRDLTLQALDELHADGVAFVFNTPNEQSRPGYLKMGWQQVGRLPLRFRPRSLATLPRILRAPVGADRWPVESASLPGGSTGDVFADHGALAALLDLVGPARGLVTRRTPAYLAWRYGLPSLGYRAVLVDEAVEEGIVVFRLRRRGRAVEATIGDCLVAPEWRGLGRLVGRLLADSRADYALLMSSETQVGLLPLLGVGPKLVWRPLAYPDTSVVRADWQLNLSDVELF